MQVADAESVVQGATGRRQTLDALEWITEGRALRTTVRGTVLLGALVVLADGAGGDIAAAANAALLRAARDVVRSGRDPGMELHDFARVTPPARYRDALSEVCRHTRSRGLDTVTAAAVMAAQTADDLVIEALCMVAGITYKELRERAAATLPVRAGSRWSQPQVEAAFSVIDSFVRGTVEQSVPDDAIIRRPAELLLAPDGRSGWQYIQLPSVRRRSLRAAARPARSGQRVGARTRTARQPSCRRASSTISASGGQPGPEIRTGGA